MKILYVTQYYPPEVAAPASRASELARHWVAEGHEVTILTGFPNHPTGKVPPEYWAKLRRLVCREEIDGVDVVRTWLLPVPNRKPLERMLNYTSFMLSASLTGLFVGRPDVVIATSPQLLVGLAGWWLARVKRVPSIFEVRDLWPESMVASGVGSDRSKVVRLLARVSAFLYRRSDHIVVVTDAFRRELEEKWHVPPERISVVENGVETELFAPTGPTLAELGASAVPEGFVVSYVGTLGLAHGLDTVLDAAATLRDSLPAARFLFIGEGADRERLVGIARERGLSNVTFLPQQPRGLIPAYIRASDVCLVPLRRSEVFKTVIPTKTLEFMACARPIVLGVEGQIRQIVEEASAGVAVPPEDASALAQAIQHLHDHPDLRRSLGLSGRQYVQRRFSRREKALGYLSVLEGIRSRLARSLPSTAAR